MTDLELAIFGPGGYKKKPIEAKRSPVKAKTISKPRTLSSKEYKELTEEEYTEEENQIQLINYLNKKDIYFEIGLEGIYLPNPHSKNSRAYNIQRASNSKVLKKLKAQGLKKGPADVKVYLPSKILHIELKRFKGGRSSPEQIETGKIVNKFSYAIYRECKGISQAIKFIEENLTEGES